jgi:anti-sigma-K factor RskA
MTETDDIDALAAEYVLGTLDATERAQVAVRRTHDRVLDAAIRAWELRLSPLDELFPEVAPPAALRVAILTRVAYPSQGAPASNVVRLERRLARWRTLAIGASALAASLGGLVVYREALRPAPATSYVAVLQKDAQSPAFLMTVDIGNKSFTVAPVSAPKPAGKSYELWLVSEKLGPPKSLGLVENAGFTVGPKLAPFAQNDIREATYAVSLEPEGGSPTGAPTGPVVYAGKLVQAKP